MNRCQWANRNNPAYVAYHDNEWGKPQHDDKKLFEFLILECFQAGLSWETILNKREAFREAFDGFDAVKVSQYGETKFNELMQNSGIIRNKLKINAAINNAGVFLEIQKEYGTFSSYIWGFTNNQIILNETDQFNTTTELSDRISKDLKKRGMKFVGSTTIYSYLQAAGIVNDHELNCSFR